MMEFVMRNRKDFEGATLYCDWIVGFEPRHKAAPTSEVI